VIDDSVDNGGDRHTPFHTPDKSRPKVGFTALNRRIDTLLDTSDHIPDNARGSGILIWLDGKQLILDTRNDYVQG
jgi:hypothetical protein